MPSLRGIAFDLDGTLASSEDVYLLVGAETLRRRGKTFEPDLRNAMMGRPAVDALQVMIDWHQLGDSVATLAEESEAIFWQLAETRLQPMPGAVDLLDWLDTADASPGGPLPRGIATSGGRRYAERIVGLLGIADRFEFLVTADDVSRGKPHPEPYLLAAERLGVAPGEMLVLEDSAVGTQAAVAAGAITVAAPNPHTEGQAFPPVALTVDTLADPRLKELVRQSVG